MSSIPQTTESWKGFVEDCLRSVAQQAFQWTCLHTSAVERSHSDVCYSASIPIRFSNTNATLLVEIDEVGAAEIAREMLMLDEDESLPDDTELADTVGEIANLVAGALKKSIVAHDPSIEIGIPDTQLCDQQTSNFAVDQPSQCTWVQFGPTLIKALFIQ